MKKRNGLFAIFLTAMLCACGSEGVAGVDEQGNSIADDPTGGNQNSSSSEVIESSGSGMGYSSNDNGSSDPGFDPGFDPSIPQGNIHIIEFSGASLDSVYNYILLPRELYDMAPDNCGLPECDFRTVKGGTQSGYLSLEEHDFSSEVMCEAGFTYSYRVVREAGVVQKILRTDDQNVRDVFENACAAEDGILKEDVCKVVLTEGAANKTPYVDPYWASFATEVINKCHD